MFSLVFNVLLLLYHGPSTRSMLSMTPVFFISWISGITTDSSAE